MNKHRLASKIWESANKMRSKIEANEYKDFILGFIFYKFLSDNELKYLKEQDWTEEFLPELKEDDIETVESVQNNLGYFISYGNLFSTWIKKGNDFKADDVTTALSAFSRLVKESHKKVFGGVFDTLETGLSKLGETAGARTKAIRDLLYLIQDIPMNGKQDYDVLGFIYEYLISNFAANAGKKAGEFYTPHEVSLLMSEIVADHVKDKVKGRETIRIYDPTSGSGSLLINIGTTILQYLEDEPQENQLENGEQGVSESEIMYFAQELKANTYNLTRMNLVLRGIPARCIKTRNGDTLAHDWPLFEDDDPANTYEPLFVDAVVSNPPYSQAWDPTGKENDPRFARFGLAPKTKADYAFLLHDLFHLKHDGIMAIVLPHGVLFRGGEEGEIRKNLIESNHVDAVIGLPPNIFFGTGIPTIIMVLKKTRTNNDVLFVDASKGFEKIGKNNELRARDIKKIADAVISRASVDNFSRVVPLDEIRANDYNLNIPRYVNSAEVTENWDLYSSIFGGISEAELKEFSNYWETFPTLRGSLFTASAASEIGGYYDLKVKALRNAIQSHPEVQAFITNYQNTFTGFEDYLVSHLIDSAASVNISKEKTEISKNIFDRLKQLPLVDPYSAYQFFHDQWKDISADLEIIQTEGFSATKKVDPLMVIRKKNGREEEIQDGWEGHVIPFSMVQQERFSDKLKTIKEIEDRLSGFADEFQSLLDGLSEEQRSLSFVNEENDQFIRKEVNKHLKENVLDEETLEVLRKVKKLTKDETELKKKLKNARVELSSETKETIEQFEDDDVKYFLKLKWLKPLVNGLYKLSGEVINTLVAELEFLSKKYEVTLQRLERQTRETEASLYSMMEDLSGCDSDKRAIEGLRELLKGTNNA